MGSIFLKFTVPSSSDILAGGYRDPFDERMDRRNIGHMAVYRVQCRFSCELFFQILCHHSGTLNIHPLFSPAYDVVMQCDRQANMHG